MTVIYKVSTFEDITSNKAQYDYTVTYYATSATANSEKIKKKIFSVPGSTDITATYTHVEFNAPSTVETLTP
jgi:hypothetical protein